MICMIPNSKKTKTNLGCGMLEVPLTTNGPGLLPWSMREEPRVAKSRYELLIGLARKVGRKEKKKKNHPPQKKNA